MAYRKAQCIGQWALLGVAVGFMVLFPTQSRAGWLGRAVNGPPLIILPNAETLNTNYIRIVPNIPNYTTSFSLKGIEAQSERWGAPILSPQQDRYVASHATYLPYKHQTIATVELFSVPPLPTKDRYALPMTSKDRHPPITKKRYWKDPTPAEILSYVDPQPFWQRYQPHLNASTSTVLLTAGYDTTQQNYVQLYQAIDWHRDGQFLLVSYREGIEHLGIWRTVPLVVNTNTLEVLQLRFLPEMIWQRYHQDRSATPDPKKVWDLRLLGWLKSQPDSMVINLVGFLPPNPATGLSPKEEVMAQYRYDITEGHLYPLISTGQSTDNEIANNGWLVLFQQPQTTKAPAKQYAPHELPQSPTPLKAPQPPVIPRSFWTN